MWLITEFGFYSIVQKPDDAARGTLTIRGRVRQDLEYLRTVISDLSAIEEDTRADYRFRATAPRESVATAMAAMVRALTYPNFKDRVAEVQGDQRAMLYYSVWAALARLQQRPRAFGPSMPVIYASIGKRPDVLDDDDASL
jgi:hypothetical protein